MDERQSKLLQAIIDQFIISASPIGSKKLIELGSFHVSSATIRNEMGHLEDEGYLEQPHISAGRIPTASGYRAYVRECMRPDEKESLVHERFASLRDQYYQRKDQERVYEAVALLSQMIPNIAFATVPGKSRVYYLGLRNALKQPEFQENPLLASGIAEVLEEDLGRLLDEVEVDESIRYYIGERDILSKIESCSLIVRSFSMRDEGGVIGILGPMRMDYAYNTVALDLVSDLIQSY